MHRQHSNRENGKMHRQHSNGDRMVRCTDKTVGHRDRMVRCTDIIVTGTEW